LAAMKDLREMQYERDAIWRGRGESVVRTLRAAEQLTHEEQWGQASERP
jgi:hypothetical protein